MTPPRWHCPNPAQKGPRSLGLRLGLELLLLGLTASCSPLEDHVFEVVAIELSTEPLRVAEGSGVVSIPIRLTRPASQEITVSYRAVELTAQNGCQLPDFEAAAGKLVWPAGESIATLPIWIEDDLLAETDERLKLVFDVEQGPLLASTPEIELEIIDDDRTGSIDARETFGVRANVSGDQSRALQAALDAAAASLRGVVVLEPGDYEVASVSLHPGTTLSARGAVFHRPARSAADAKTVSVEHSGSTDSLPTLIEGLNIDGERDQQGPYQAYERDTANLVALEADPALPGRLQISLESLRVSDGTGDGLALGTNVDGNFCHLLGDDLWRDMLSVRGGNTRLRVRDLDATASFGKTGLWFDGGTPGYGGTHRVDIELDDVRLETGDLEIDVADASRVTLQRLVMTSAPFRLVAPASSVVISDSVITTGIRAISHGYWGPFQDVTIRNSTLRISETDETGTGPVAIETPEADRVLAPILIQWTLVGTSVAPGNLLLENCRFDQADDVEATDSVYAINSRGPGPTIRITSSTLPASFKGWFAPGCVDCQVSP